MNIDSMQSRSQDGATNVDAMQSRPYRGPFERRPRAALQQGKQTSYTASSYQTNQPSVTGRQSHQKQYCPAKDAKCHQCSKTGHFASVCLSKKIGAVCDDGNDTEYTFLGSVADNKPTVVDNTENGGSGVKFRIDTGADETVIPEQLYNELIGVNPLRKANKKLFGVGNNGLLDVVGMFATVLQGKTTATKQNIYVVRGIHKALRGNPAIDALRLISRVESVEGATENFRIS